MATRSVELRHMECAYYFCEPLRCRRIRGVNRRIRGVNRRIRGVKWNARRVVQAVEGVQPFCDSL